MTANLQDIPTHIKNKDLVARRRRQLVDAAVELFIANGFHKTTTRQIAQAAGISIGLMYEYIECKEDILYLVCEAIHAEMEQNVAQAIQEAPGQRHPLAAALAAYFGVCHRMKDHILLIYQETQSLPAKWRKVVLANEIRITGLFTNVLVQLIERGELPYLTSSALDLIAHNISVLGHMWTFRRWYLACHYTIDEYIALQTDFIMGLCQHAAPAVSDALK